MTINDVKNNLEVHKGDNVKINCNIGRNKSEIYDVTIKELYDNIFLVKMNNGIKEIKSFSYNDVITKNIKIQY